MGYVMGIRGDGFAMVCVSADATQQIITMKDDEDKILAVDDHRLLVRPPPTTTTTPARPLLPRCAAVTLLRGPGAPVPPHLDFGGPVGAGAVPEGNSAPRCPCCSRSGWGGVTERTKGLDRCMSMVGWTIGADLSSGGTGATPLTSQFRAFTRALV